MEKLIVWNRQTLYRIRIEIVVHVYSVYIVTTHDIFCHLTDVIAILLDTRIKNKQIVVSKTVAWLAYSYVILGQLVSNLSLSTEWVNPCVQLHTALMALGNHPLQRIPVRRWCFALNASKKTAPRLNLALIQSVALRTNLEYNQVYAILLQLVQLVSQRLLHFLGSQILELSVNTLYPCSTHFSLLSTCSHCHH